MSNENSTTNIPRRGPYISRGSNPIKSGKSRRFHCITYLNEMQLKVVLMYRTNQIRSWAYAYHDKDTKEDGTPKEPHFHILLVTHSAHTLSAIRRWFGDYYDENGEITTTAQICQDIYDSYKYLWHGTKQAREQGKYLYDKSIVKVDDKQRVFQASEEAEFDTITLAAEALINGVSVRELGKRYGRDFILHYGAIRQYASDVIYHKNHSMTFENVVEREYDLYTMELNKL